MKSQILFLLFNLVTTLGAVSQHNHPSTSVNYNAELAQKLGADDYGMKSYVIAFLKAGPVKLTDSLTRAELQKAHLKNITRLAEEGKLIIAGPFTDDQPLRGIFIFDVTTIEEARELTSTDPAINAGTLVMELHPRYGPATIKEIPKLQKQIQKRGFDE